MSILDDPGNEALPTEQFAADYFDARQNFDWLAVDAASSLIRGTSFVLNRYHGRWQPWVVEAVEADDPPTRLLQAICEAALLLGQGVDLSPMTTEGALKKLRVRVEGAVEREQEWDTASVPTKPSVTVIDDLLRGLVRSHTSVRLMRA